MSSTSANSPIDLRSTTDPAGRTTALSSPLSSPYMICIVSVMPLRAAPADSSEMVSQLLFGEAVEVLETKAPGWVRIRNQFDQYEGWAATNQLASIDEDLYREPVTAYSSETFTTLQVNGHSMPLSRGSFLRRIEDGKMQWNGLQARYDGNPIHPRNADVADKKALERGALQYLNTPYLWGGRSAFGMDCSGFVQSVFRMMGIALPRDASQQAGQGTPISAAPPWQTGDLAFFSAPGKNTISHVGILLPEGKIIHASGQVRIDLLDTTGIYRRDISRHTHHLVTIRRII